VANAIRLLDLPDDVLELLEKGELTGAHGRALLMTRDNDTRRRLSREAVAAGWSVKDTEKRAKAAQAELDGTAPKKAAARPPADLVDAMAAAADALTAATGHDVKVNPAGRADPAPEHLRTASGGARPVATIASSRAISSVG
jgi:ParB family transcriptional regulator, chromosome partitioning protein